MERSLFALLAAAISLPAGAQHAPLPDPRLEPLLNRTVIAQIQRSVELERAFPQPAAPLDAKRPTAPEQPGMVRAAEGLYIERSLAPRRRADDKGAVRVFPRDAR